MSDQMQLEAQKRDRVGKGAARAIRREGRVPAVIYGDKKPALPISIDFVEVLKQLHTGQFLSTIYKVNVDGETISVIPKDFQLDVVKDLPMHVDFLRLSKGAKVDVEVNVHFENEEISVGLKKGGSLNIVRHTLELSCPQDNIPEEILVDLAEVDIGDAIHLSDITIPAGAEISGEDRDFTIATIVAPGGTSDDDDAPTTAGEVEAGATTEEDSE